MNNSNSQKFFYINLLNVLSAISVIILHTNCFWTVDVYSSRWISANIIECLFYFAVPVFFMNIGATLIDYQDRYGTKEYFRRRINKCVIPFIAWSLIGTLFSVFKNDFAIASLTTVLNEILNANAMSVYWFFLPLFGIYLSIPVLAAIDKEKRIATMKYAAIFGFIFNILLPFVNRYSALNIASVSVSIVSGYLFYVSIGYVLSHSETINHMGIMIVLGITGLLIHIIGTYNLSIKSGHIDQTYKGYLSLPCVLYSVCIYLLGKRAGEKLNNKERFKKVINYLSKYTFAMYLIHLFIIQLSFHFFKFDTTSLIFRLFYPFVVAIICVFITNITRRIPILRRIVPE